MWNQNKIRKSLISLTKLLDDKQKNEPYWTFSNGLSEDLVAESRGLTPNQWRQENDEDKALMIATYRSKRKMKNYEMYHHSKDYPK